MWGRWGLFLVLLAEWSWFRVCFALEGDGLGLFVVYCLFFRLFAPWIDRNRLIDESYVIYLISCLVNVMYDAMKNSMFTMARASTFGPALMRLLSMGVS